MSTGVKILIIFLFTSSTSAFSQSRFSPQIATDNFIFRENKTLFSVCVKDSIAFLKKHKDNITIQSEHRCSNCFVVKARYQNTFQALKNDSNVLFIDHHKKPVTESSLDYVNTSFNRIGKAHQYFTKLTGVGQKISVKEQLFDTANIDLLHRSFTTPITPASSSQHATAMAILIAGAGNSSFHAKGVAPEAHLTSSDFSNLFPDDASVFTANSIHLQNHSYGVGIENYYGNEAFAYDQQVNQNPTLLHVFSAGNLGKSKPSSGAYQNMNFATLSGNFKQAKNVLVVNAVDTTLVLNANNSRGPAFDGRVKPELTVYGQGGTSDAAALASGVTLLVQEKYQMLIDTPPAASMVKAILIASADDIGPQGIDYLYGYGSVNAYNALKLVELNQMVSVELSSNEEVSIPLDIPNAIAALIIAVTWTDLPAEPNSNQVLVNDIDSRLEDGTNSVLPWVLSSYPNTDSLIKLPSRKADHLNNTEYIKLDNPISGLYQLKLRAGNLSSDKQNVSVAYWLKEKKTFSWDFPVLKDIVESRKKNLLVWEGLPNQVGNLYYQINQGSWQLIESNIDLNHYFYWMAPDTLANAHLKMNVGAEEFVSDEFIISPTLQLKSAFLCVDSIGLTWNGLKNATHYDLYTIGSQSLEKIATVSDTLIVLSKSAYQYFAVAPVLNGISGLKSETVNHKQQGASCYINLFAAQRFNVTQIKIQLLLSSLHEVDRITIFKTFQGTRFVFKTLSSPSQPWFEFYDSELLPGTMVYQAEINFKSDVNILSEVVEVTIEEKGKVILYPNPVSNNSDLNIISEGGALEFRILDAFGRMVAEKELSFVEESIDLINLPSGIYFYQLYTRGRLTDSGKLVKY